MPHFAKLLLVCVASLSLAVGSRAAENETKKAEKTGTAWSTAEFQDRFGNVRQVKLRLDGVTEKATCELTDSWRYKDKWQHREEKHVLKRVDANRFKDEWLKDFTFPGSRTTEVFELRKINGESIPYEDSFYIVARQGSDPKLMYIGRSRCSREHQTLALKKQ